MSKHFQSGQHPDADQISAFVDHALPAHEGEEMLVHLSECKDCREIVAFSLPPVETAPVAVKKSKWWLWDLRILLPACAAAVAVLLLYVDHSTNSRPDVKRGPDIALERKAAPPEDRRVSPGGAGGGAGSTSFAGRVQGAPGKTPYARATVPPRKQGAIEANGLALDAATEVVAVHLPDGSIPISTVTRGSQVLAIDDRNQLFLSNDRGVSWLAVRVPWRGRAIRAELASFPVLATPRQQAAAGVDVGFGAGIGGGSGATSMNSDAARFEKQKELRQELKGSYKAAANGNSDSPPATPAPALTAPVPSAPSAVEAALSGVITDRSGAIISGASVVLTKQEDHASSTAVTGNDGRYQMAGLAPGRYQLEARAPGFNVTRISGIQIEPSASNARNLVLDVGAASQTVAVEANSPEIQLALPELGRNATSLKQKSASPNALVRPVPVFEITTDSGDHWISSDGVNWQRQ